MKSDSLPDESGDALDRAIAIFGQLLELSAETQQRRLTMLEDEDPTLASAVRELLRGDREADERFDLGAAAQLTRTDGPEPQEGVEGFTAELMKRLVKHQGSFNRYEIKGELARGGQGVILQIRDEVLDRPLAMKVALGRVPTEPTGETPKIESKTLGRFLDEAHVTGKLDHPGIVPVHDLGIDTEGRAYFTMKLVRGKTLKEVFEELERGEGGWTRARVLGLILKACEAMSYAHAKGVIHRDLKPSNVMVGNYGEVYVMDWGLAKVLGRADERDLRLRAEPAQATNEPPGDREDRGGEASDPPLYTMDGDVMGTPAYMSPEQASGLVAEMGPPSDVYALGAILYHLLAGHQPYAPKGTRLSSIAIWSAVKAGPPTALHAAAPQAPSELIAICEKSMSRDAQARYPSTSELAEDLAAYVEGRVVHAYEAGAWAEARKWVKRNKPLASSLAAVILAIAIGGMGFAFKADQATRATDRADIKASEAQEQREVAEARAGDVLRLSALQDLEDLLADADELWPPHPENIASFRKWIQRGEALMAELPRYEAKRVELRALALPRSEEQLRAERESHLEFVRLDELQARIDMLRRALVQRRDGITEELPPFDLSTWFAPTKTLNGAAWELVKADRKTFGQEPRGLQLALRAMEQAGENAALRANVGDTLAWALLALGRDDDAKAASLAALELASDELKPAFERSLAELDQAIAAASTEEAFEAVAVEISKLEAELASIDARVDKRQDWRFPEGRNEARWWNAQLTKLIDGLQALRDPRTGLLTPEVISPEHGWSLQRRIAFAEELESDFAPGGTFSERWGESLPTIEVTYPGLQLSPQMGLVPIGPDPASGLWEFWHVATGVEPTRNAERKLLPTEDTGVVLVLIPGGSFWMGAQIHDRTGPNYDPRLVTDEGPVHEVELSPYFLSKYELTQGQWLRIAGRNPSYYPPRRHGTTLAHPVEQVNWLDCMKWLPRVGLALPSEAQWERGCRAGTDTVWWTGSERESLRELQAANLADQSAARIGVSWEGIWDWPELDDGYWTHAPVGSLAANGFGLHEMHGNVVEWCLDGYDHDFYRKCPKRDPVMPPERSERRVVRGGHFAGAAIHARSAMRHDTSQSSAGHSSGMRPARAITR